MTNAECVGFEDDCNFAICSPVTQTCIQIPRPPVLCDDGYPCTEQDRCFGGTCQGGTQRDCSAVEDQCNTGACSAAAGGCIPVTVMDGTPCDDGDVCTIAQCQAGTCTPVVPGTAPGDTCIDAIPVNPSVGPNNLFNGTNTCANDDMAGSCAGSIGRDVVYRMELTETRRVVISTEDPAATMGYDTVLYVRDQCANPATERICDDDSGPGTYSMVDEVFTPNDYFVWLDAFGNSQGDYALRFDVDPQNTCQNPSTLPFPAVGQTLEVVGNTSGADNTFEANCAGKAASPDHVYRLDVPQPSRLVLETLSVSANQYDTSLHIRTNPCDSMGPSNFACDDDSGNGLLSRIEGDFPAGTYWVIVDGWSSGRSGEYRLAITQLSNMTVPFVFPEATDGRVNQVPGGFSRAGDFVEGPRDTPLSTITRMNIDVSIANNLTCDIHETIVIINGTPVGVFVVVPGQTQVMQTFNFPTISGPRYSLRYETARDIAPGCGNIDFPDGVSTVGLGN